MKTLAARTRLVLTGAALVGWLAPMAGQADTGTLLGTVHITTPVIADGKPLSPGTYQVRLTDDHPQPQPGQSADAERWVEFLQSGAVVAREAAEVLPGPAAVGTSSSSGRAPLKAEMLKGGEFLRLSTNREGARYLIYLALPASAPTATP